jgi:hypothetical protein
MSSRILEWASITTLLLVVAWRPSAGPHLPLDLMVCAGTVMLALGLLFRRDLELHLAPLVSAGRGAGRRP